MLTESCFLCNDETDMECRSVCSRTYVKLSWNSCVRVFDGKGKIALARIEERESTAGNLLSEFARVFSTAC